MLALIMVPALAQDNQKPLFLPGDGVYLIGIYSDHPASRFTETPTMVTQAYKAKFDIKGSELAAVRVGTKSYNLTEYINDDETELNLVPFLGIGEVNGLIVRNMEGESYQLGDYAPTKTWNNTYLYAATDWMGTKAYPLCVYNQWDCPVTFDADPMLADGSHDAVTVNFGNPYEGLVLSDINFPVCTASDNDNSRKLTVTLKVWNEECTEVIESFSEEIAFSAMDMIEENGICRSNVNVQAEPASPIVINTPFTVTISGFAQDGVKAWLPRAVDANNLFPTHTSYTSAGTTEQVATSDACINITGYFNYLGTWGWYDGKYERGEVVAAADLVQIYYDPADEDWPGDYFMGEAAFPVECTYGAHDIEIESMPEWINSISYDNSQWEEYGAVQLTLSADALPADMNGRNGKVELITSDGASRYTIYIRQGAAWFDMGNETTLNAHTVSIPADGGTYDLLGRRTTNRQKNTLLIRNNKITIEK